jgi:HptB-dependent secretion and biofilm anti anti-sigma factor
VTITKEHDRDEKEVTIRISGDFDFSTLDQFRQAYSGIDLNLVNLIIDLSDAKHLNSEGLGMLLILREYAGGDESNLSVTGCGADIRRIFNASGFEKLFDISE